MKAIDIVQSIVIILVFAGIFLYSMLKTQFKEINENWPKYRCNPAIMPFAGQFGHNPQKNFTYCIQNMQTNYMGFLLTPLHFITSQMGSMIGDIINDVNMVRVKIASVVGNIMKVVTSIFSVFINMMIEFQRIIVKLKDTISKTIGLSVVTIYILMGGMMTGTSIIEGPIGDTLTFMSKF